jgi:hypothetical protein
MNNEQEHIQVAVTQNDIRAIKKEVEQVSGKVNEVHQALIGSPLAQDGGMVRRLHDCEKDLDALREKITVMERNNVKSELYVKIIWGVSGGLFMAIAALIMNHFFNK